MVRGAVEVLMAWLSHLHADSNLIDIQGVQCASETRAFCGREDIISNQTQHKMLSRKRSLQLIGSARSCQARNHAYMHPNLQPPIGSGQPSQPTQDPRICTHLCCHESCQKQLQPLTRCQHIPQAQWYNVEVQVRACNPAGGHGSQARDLEGPSRRSAAQGAFKPQCRGL